MDLREMQNSHKLVAEMLGDYQLMTKTELANGYCDMQEKAWEAKEVGDKKNYAYYEEMRNAYNSALMLRYWYKIFEWMQNSSSLRLPATDFVDWLYKGLWVAFYYKAWRYEYEAEVKEGHFIKWKLDADGNKIPNKYYWRKDPDAPDKMINRCCGSIRGRAYQYYNKDKRKSNTQTYSLDTMVDEDGDGTLINSGCFEEKQSGSKIDCLISDFLGRGEGLEALIVDGIANYDTYKVSKQEEKEMIYDEDLDEEVETSVTRYKTAFDARKLVKHLNQIDEDFMKRFCRIYAIEKVYGDSLFDTLKKTSNVKLYKAIEKTLQEIRNDKNLLSYLS